MARWIREALLVVVLASAVVHAGTGLRRTCATTPTSEEVRVAKTHYDGLVAANRTRGHAIETTGTLVDSEIPVYIHIVTRDAGHNSPGTLTQPQITKQMDVLNQAFSSTGLTFTLADTTLVANASYFDAADPCLNLGTANVMKRALRRGGANALNVFTVRFANGTGICRGLLGYSTMPYTYGQASEEDGVMLNYGTLPGGALSPFNLGATLVHEVGHWVGLYHTFQGGCGADGDLVDDTPPESAPSYGCPDGRDTCPAPGLDPIHNYMDYSDDSCLTEFTPGQVRRIQEQMTAYRGVQFAAN